MLTPTTSLPLTSKLHYNHMALPPSFIVIRGVYSLTMFRTTSPLLFPLHLLPFNPFLTHIVIFPTQNNLPLNLFPLKLLQFPLPFTTSFIQSHLLHSPSQCMESPSTVSQAKTFAVILIYVKLIIQTCDQLNCISKPSLEDISNLFWF